MPIFAGLAVGKLGFDPAFDTFIKSIEKQIPDALDRMKTLIKMGIFVYMI
ncbi:hypothetical protein [Mannheimia indoligenes]|uniref:Uncharacterized protein n=1 Tax=Mannheimia indoligenes TaxID=3103145 RepID=A0ABU7ZD04_9PAST